MTLRTLSGERSLPAVPAALAPPLPGPRSAPRLAAPWRAPRLAPRPQPDGLVGPPRRRLLIAVGLLALVASLAGHVLAMYARTDPVVDILLAQLPVLFVLAGGCCSLSRTLRSPLRALVEMGSRAELAERELAREHDRIHELRATLAAVSASHRLLHDPRTQLSPHRKRRLQRMHDAELDRLERLLADHPEPVGAVDLDEVISSLVDAAGALGVDVRYTGRGGRVHGRTDAITEALHVLLDNAARHGGGRGVEVSVTRRGREVDVSVTDHGPGIAPEVAGRAFERGVRGPRSTGHGLGLSIARRRAEEVGGHLRLVPRPPGATGACFVLTLLAHSEAQECRAALN